MATSIIPKQASEPEFITQNIYAMGSVRKSGSSYIVAITSQQGVNSGSATYSSSRLTINLNVAKTGYKLVGLKKSYAVCRADYGSTEIGPINSTGSDSVAWAEVDDNDNIVIISDDLSSVTNTAFRLGVGSYSGTHYVTAVYVKI